MISSKFLLFQFFHQYEPEYCQSKSVIHILTFNSNKNTRKISASSKISKNKWIICLQDVPNELYDLHLIQGEKQHNPKSFYLFCF